MGNIAHVTTAHVFCMVDKIVHAYRPSPHLLLCSASTFAPMTHQQPPPIRPRGVPSVAFEVPSAILARCFHSVKEAEGRKKAPRLMKWDLGQMRGRM